MANEKPVSQMSPKEYAASVLAAVKRNRPANCPQRKAIEKCLGDVK